MAKIPSFNPNPRLSGDAPRKFVDPGEARRMPEAVAQLGKGIQSFAGGLDTYLENKRKVDDALQLALLHQEIQNKGLEAENFAKTNPNGARDGSSLVIDFESKFSEVRDKVEGLEDNRLRGQALQLLTNADVKYKDRLFKHGIVRHNESVMESSQETLNGMGLRVQQDPGQINEVLSEFDLFSSQMPYAGKDSIKFNRTGKRELINSALESFASKGMYTEAKGLLYNTNAGSFFTGEERRALFEKYTQREVNEKKNAFTLENMKLKKLRLERQEIQDQTELNMFDSLSKATSPEDFLTLEKSALEARAKGHLSSSAYNALRVNQDRIEQGVSTSTRNDYFLKYLKGQGYESLKSEIMQDMASEKLKHADGFSLLKNISAQVKREKLDPVYKAKKQVAKDYIKSRVKPSGFSYGSLVYGQKEKQLLAEINEEMLRLESNGAEPIMAAKLASAKVIGLQQFSESTDKNIVRLNDDLKGLKEYKKQVDSRIKGLKGQSISLDTKKKILQEAREIEARIEALEAQEEYKRLMGVKQVEEVKR